MKRFASFCMGFLPLACAEAAIYLSQFFMLAISVFTELCNPLLYSDTSTQVDRFSRYYMKSEWATVSMLIYCIVVICVCTVLYLTFLGGERRISDAFSHLNIQLTAAAVLLSCGLLAVSTLLCNLVFWVYPASEAAYENLMESSGMTTYTLLLFLYTIFLGPICEELLFRGLTLRLFSRSVRFFWIANILQAFLFGCYHGNLVQGIYAFVIGLVLGYVCEKSGTILYSMLLHMLYNGWGFLEETVLADLLSVYFWEIAALVFMGLCLIGGIILFIIGTHIPASDYD